MKYQFFGLILTILLAAAFTTAAQDALVWDPAQETETKANNGLAVITGHGDVLPEGVVVRFIRIEGGGR